MEEEKYLAIFLKGISFQQYFSLKNPTKKNRSRIRSTLSSDFEALGNLQICQIYDFKIYILVLIAWFHLVRIGFCEF